MNGCCLSDALDTWRSGSWEIPLVAKYCCSPERKTSTGSRASAASLAYFFIKEGDQQLRSIHNILKSIAFQITENDQVYYKYVAPICAAPERLSTAKDAWKALFLDFLSSCSQLIFDRTSGPDGD